MRADAQRNRERLLNAAVELVLEKGGEPARDAIAERACVGIGTLYRHFPDRQSLLYAIARHALDRSIDAGREALASSDSGFEAIRHYMHAAVDNGLGALNILYPLLDAPSWPEQRVAADAMLHAMVDRAQREGTIGNDVAASDIALAVIRFCRPLAVGLPADDERAIAHRHIDTYLNGLAQNPTNTGPRRQRAPRTPDAPAGPQEASRGSRRN